MADAAGSGRPPIRVGAVVSRGVGVYLRNIVSFLILTVVAFLPAFLAETIATASAPATVTAAVVWTLLVMLLWILGWSWFSAGVTYGVIADLRGRRASIGDVLGASLRPAVQLVVLTFLVSLLGALFMVVLMFAPPAILVLLPLGLVLYIVLWVTVPAMVVEGLGPIAGMRRSRALTQGAFWRILGVVLLWIVLLLAISFVVGLVSGATQLEGQRIGTSLEAGTSSDWISNIVTFVVFGIGAAIGAVGYHDLRVSKEGVDTNDIARVFD